MFHDSFQKYCSCEDELQLNTSCFSNILSRWRADVFTVMGPFVSGDPAEVLLQSCEVISSLLNRFCSFACCSTLDTASIRHQHDLELELQKYPKIQCYIHYTHLRLNCKIEKLFCVSELYFNSVFINICPTKINWLNAYFVIQKRINE